MGANQEIIAELRRVLNERDEAREQLDLTKRELGRWVDRETKAVRERDEARASVADAYRRGAEAMRKRCAMEVRGKFLGTNSDLPRIEVAVRIEAALLALPIPEEP